MEDSVPVELIRGYKTMVERLRYMGMRVMRSSPQRWYAMNRKGDWLRTSTKLTSILEKKYQEKYGYIGEED